jgi:hypothetical protein
MFWVALSFAVFFRLPWEHAPCHTETGNRRINDCFLQKGPIHTPRVGSTGCSFGGALYLSSEKSQSLLLKAARAVGTLHPVGFF